MAKPRAKDDPGLTVAEWDARLADLQRRQAETKAGLAALSDRRRAIALKVTDGDAAATEELAGLNSKTAELIAAEDMLSMSLEQATQSRDAAAKQEALAAEADRQSRITATCRRVVEASAKADVAFAALRVALEARKKAARELYNLDFPQSRLLLPAGVQRAACHHGLETFLGIERSLTRHAAPLAIGDAELLALRSGRDVADLAAEDAA
ncbi:hypothetical protein KPL78_06535 [Roseomonas sp. HJA6]|uniref:Chromosome segregation protein SMC n=1 Tax=Roseomonas alba TaxID=2846776 RepID=A0ABS7A5E3_9PROT|nr:hypothetical protein [Neoroseomonas alba]MBW6397495.1 hypothetical protein [Neoroseomonas alba]